MNLPDLREINVPAPLRDLKCWLLWRKVQRPGNKKPKKIPFYANGTIRRGEHGSERDRAHLVTFYEARKAALEGGYDGVGIALLPGMKVLALDIDNCIRPDGKCPDEILAGISGTYAELSPSGNGIRAIFWDFSGEFGNRKSGTTETQYGFELFSTKGFVTITGNALAHIEVLGLENTISVVTLAAKQLIEKRFGENRAITDSHFDNADPLARLKPKVGISLEEARRLVFELDPDMERDDWTKAGMALHHEFEGSDEAFEIWNDWSSQGIKYESEDELRYQWESFDRNRSNPNAIGMASVIWMVKALSGDGVKLIANPKEIEAALADVQPIRDAGEIGTPANFDGKYPALSAAGVSRRPPMKWHIKGVLPDADLGVLYGKSGSGKSFVAEDMAITIARGLPWVGHRCAKGRVLIIAAEGGGGIGKRLEAYATYHKLELNEIDVAVMTAAPDFLQKSEIAEVAKTVRAAGGFDIIIIDTLAQVTPGANENSAEDMGLALGNAKALKAVTGAFVLLVHHAGKDAARGARGWSGIKAAADVEFEVTKDTGGYHTIQITKMKDGEEGRLYSFRLQQVALGHDDDGDPITSCVVEHVDSNVARRARSELRSGSTKALLLEAAASLGGRSTEGADEIAVVQQAVRGMRTPKGKRDYRNSNAKKELKGLIETGFLIRGEGKIRIPDSDLRSLATGANLP